MKNLAVLAAILIGITDCSGGGTSTATPTVALTLSQSKVSLGSSVNLTWTSTNVTSCTASGAWNGTQAISGTSVQTPTASGAKTYTLTCNGPDGSTNQTATLTVPIPVQKSSYENKALAGGTIGAQTLPSEVVAGNAVAFADFFQDGTYSMVTHSLEYNSQDSFTANKVGHIHFWKNVSGSWVDNTSTLLTNNSGCLHPRKAGVADFNGDGKPDIFFACHGFDAPPFSGESPIVVLSQADGTYKSVVVSVTCFCHSASAADINGDGFPDVLVTGDISASTPFFLINNKDGTFTRDLTRLPSNTQFKPIFTAELIDFAHTGNYDAFLGGHEQDPSANWPATIVPNDGNGSFALTTQIVLPSLQGYGFPTDIVYKADNIYLLRTIDASSNFYGGTAVQKIAFPSLNSQTLYQHTTAYPSGTFWVNWIISNGSKINSLDTSYGMSVPQ